MSCCAIASRLTSVLLLGVLVVVGCRPPSARSRWSFGDIEGIVAGQTAEQVVGLVGKPDTRQSVLDGDERWVWWRYTYLDGEDWPSEYRGKVVHLEILFSNPAPYSATRAPDSEWRVAEAFGVSYRFPTSGN